MLNENDVGYLINNKQIIAYAKWYLSNPIAVATDTHMISKPYTNTDIKNVKKLISKAKQNPNMVAFRKETFNKIFHNDFNTGFELGTLTSNHDINDTMRSAKDYLKSLKKQSLVSFDTVKQYAKQADKKSDAKANLFNKLITKTAKASDTRIQYKKFINNNYGDGDVIREYNRSQGYTDNDSMLARDDISNMGFHNGKIMQKPEVNTDDKWTKLYDSTHTNAYFKIALYAEFKLRLPYINLKNFKPAKSFKSDLNAKNLSKGYNYVSAHQKSVMDQAKHQMTVTDPHKMIDFEHFVLNK